MLTPEQNIKKHINSPNLMIPNKIGKPLSWYNEEPDELLEEEKLIENEAKIRVLMRH